MADGITATQLTALIEGLPDGTILKIIGNEFVASNFIDNTSGLELLGSFFHMLCDNASRSVVTSAGANGSQLALFEDYLQATIYNAGGLKTGFLYIKPGTDAQWIGFVEGTNCIASLAADLTQITLTGATDVVSLRAKALQYEPTAFASLPASPAEGMTAWVNDSTVDTWGATIAGGSNKKVFAVYNGTNWTVAGK